jgi:hypothetical protein
MLANREHVPTIARHDHLHTRAYAAGESHVVVRVTRDCFDRLRRTPLRVEGPSQRRRKNVNHINK